MPEISREDYSADRGIVGRLLAKNGGRAIRAAVVDDDNFVRSAGNLRQDRAQTAQQLRQNFFFVIWGMATERRMAQDYIVFVSALTASTVEGLRRKW